MSVVNLPKNINVNKLKYSAPKALSNGSRTVYVSYEGERLTLQTPLMSLPYGVGNGYNADKGEDDGQGKKYEANISFKGQDTNPAVKKMLDKMKEIENKIKNDCFENRLIWLRDDYDGIKSVVDRLFYPIVKYSKDKQTGKITDEYPPTMKLKFPYDPMKDAFNFECSDMNGNELDFKTIVDNLKGSKGRFVIQLAGLWFAGGKYGCTWKIIKASFEVTSKTKVTFVEDSDDEYEAKAVQSDEDVEQDAIHMASNPSPDVKVKSMSSTVIDESENEEEEEEEEDVPPPPSKSKVTRELTPEVEEEEEEDDVPPPPPSKGKKAPVRAPEPEPEDVDSELEDVPPPPPPKTTKKTAKK